MNACSTALRRNVRPLQNSPSTQKGISSHTQALCLSAFVFCLCSLALAQPAATQPSARDLVARLPGPTPATALFDFSDTPLTDLFTFANKTYNLHIIDPFKLSQRVTLKIKEPLTAADALSLLDQTLLPLGYTLLQEISEKDSGALELRIVAVTAERNITVRMESDPAQIPSSDELRTQVLTLKVTSPQKARELVASVLDKRAEVLPNPGAGTLIITDTASHIRAAAALLQALEKEAADKAPPAGK